MKTFNAEDYNRYTWIAWESLKKACRCFRGRDPEHSGYCLCGDPTNSGTVQQVKGLRRCNIKCCAAASIVKQRVVDTFNAKDRMKALEQKLKEAKMDKPMKQEGKLIDLTDFVSEESIKYA